MKAPALVGILSLYALLSGSAFLFTAAASQDIPPFTLVALRLGIGLVGLSALSLILYPRDIFPSICNVHFLKTSLVLGLFNTFIPYSVYPYAFYFNVDVGVASVFTGLTPLYSLGFIACMMPKRARSPSALLRNVLGVVLGFSGILVIALGQLSEPDSSYLLIFGYSLLLVYAASKAFSSVYGNLHVGQHNLFLLAVGQNFFGWFCAGICSYVFDYWFPPSGYADHYQFFAQTTWRSWVGVLYLGFGPSLTCYLLQFFLLREAGAMKQIVVDFLTPIVGMIEGVLFAGDWSDASALFIASEIIGALLLFVGVLFVHSAPSVKSGSEGGVIVETPTEVESSYLIQETEDNKSVNI